MGRAPCCEKIGLKKGRWTTEEDDALTKYIQTHGEGSWRSLPKNAGLLRCGKSCRLRWINYLRNDLKRGNISSQEEDMIIKLHASLGNRWSLIACQLPGRTDNEIKNYWNSHLSRKIDTFRRSNDDPLPILLNLSTTKKGPAKKKCGRTSRSTMKKKNNSTEKSSGNNVNMEQENQEVVPRSVDGTLVYSNNEDSDANNVVGDFEMGDLMLYGPVNDNQYHQESCNSTNSNSNNSTSDLSAPTIPDDGLESGLMSFLDISYEGTKNNGMPIIGAGDDQWDWQGFIQENIWSTFEQDDQLLDGQKLEEEKMLSCFWDNSDQESSQKQDALVDWLLS